MVQCGLHKFLLTSLIISYRKQLIIDNVSFVEYKTKPEDIKLISVPLRPYPLKKEMPLGHYHLFLQKLQSKVYCYFLRTTSVLYALEPREIG